MASPAPETSHRNPLTPPTEPSPSQAQNNTSQVTSAPVTSQTSQPSSQRQLEALLAYPQTSLTDDGKSKRPRDHRIIHLLLASHGITAYQSRVPLQLMDFAYRYTSGVLSDAAHIQAEGYDLPPDNPNSAGTGKKSKGPQTVGEQGDLSMAALRLAIASRMQYSFNGSSRLPKEFLKEVADERNRVGLGVGLRAQAVGKDADGAGPVIGGVKLPHERFCLSGVGWGIKEAWESEGEEEVDGEDEIMGGMNGLSRGHELPETEIDGDAAEDGIGDMDDFFGVDGGGDGDEDMEDS